MMAAMTATAADGARPAIRVEDFSTWMAAEQKRVFLLCLRLLRNPEDADTATQDAFFKAYRALERGAGPDIQEPAKWITRIAVNTCLDRLRSNRWKFWRRRPDQEDERTLLALAASGAPDPESEFFSTQIGKRLCSALDSLSDRQRSVFVLRHYEDRSLEEIAVILGVDIGTVKAHMARALSKLRAELKDLYGRQALERR